MKPSVEKGLASHSSISSNGADDTTIAVIDNHESHNDKSGNNEFENNEIAAI